MNVPFDFQSFKKAVADGQIIWRKHALEKMLARGISRADVVKVIQSGTTIQIYEEDKPFISALILGFSHSRPIHVVASFDEANLTAFIITAYEPDRTVFEPDFIKKRK